MLIILFNIVELQKLCNDESIAITKHVRQRLIERSITIADVQNAIRTGETIKQYEDDKPFPSCLLLGKTEQDSFIHVVVSVDAKYLYIITAYYPNENEWESDLKTRKAEKS